MDDIELDDALLDEYILRAAAEPVPPRCDCSGTGSVNDDKRDDDDAVIPVGCRPGAANGGGTIRHIIYIHMIDKEREETKSHVM